MITFRHQGDLRKTSDFLSHAVRFDALDILRKYGEEGVKALSSATPVDSGKTAGSWSYQISGRRGSYTISWTNSHVNQGVNIAIILQYGHGTGTGGYVQGRDYINPAIRPIFDQIASDAFKEVTG